MIDLTPPRDLETEKALLSGLFVDPDKLDLVAGVVTAECFYANQHQAIFRAIESLHAAGEPVEPLTVHNELKKAKARVSLSEVQEIASYYPTGLMVEAHAEIVKEKHARRVAIATMKNALVAAADESQNIRDLIATVQKQLDDTLPSDHRRKVSNIYPEILDIWERILDIEQGGEKSYIETGFYDLDEAVALANGTLTILGASPRVGKTSFCLCAMRNIEKQGKRPLLFTLEMTRERIIQNIIAQEMGVVHQDMIRGRLSEDKQLEITKRAGEWKKSKIGVLDGRWSASQIRHRVIQERREPGVDIVFVDVLGKMLPPEGMGRDSLHKIFNANCQALVDLAIELNIPVVLTAHLNRDVKDGSRPTLFSLREAGEEFADNVILMHREYLSNPTPENKNIAEFIIAKNRDGDINTVELGWDGPTKTFYNLARSREEMYWDK
jgi:replicative DNA helicase